MPEGERKVLPDDRTSTDASTHPRLQGNLPSCCSSGFKEGDTLRPTGIMRARRPSGSLFSSKNRRVGLQHKRPAVVRVSTATDSGPILARRQVCWARGR